jgi:hypothetical protein
MLGFRITWFAATFDGATQRSMAATNVAWMLD